MGFPRLHLFRYPNRPAPRTQPASFPPARCSPSPLVVLGLACPRTCSEGPEHPSCGGGNGLLRSAALAARRVLGPLGTSPRTARSHPPPPHSAFSEDAPQARLSGIFPRHESHHRARSRTSATRFPGLQSGEGGGQIGCTNANPFVMLGLVPSIHRAASAVACGDVRRSRLAGSSGPSDQARGRHGEADARQHQSPDTPHRRDPQPPPHAPTSQPAGAPKACRLANQEGAGRLSQAHVKRRRRRPATCMTVPRHGA